MSPLRSDGVIRECILLSFRSVRKILVAIIFGSDRRNRSNLIVGVPCFSRSITYACIHMYVYTVQIEVHLTHSSEQPAVPVTAARGQNLTNSRGPKPQRGVRAGGWLAAVWESWDF